MLAGLLLDLVAALWAPPERLLRRTWRFFGRRSAPMRTVGFLLCTLIVLATLALYSAVVIAFVGGVVLLAELL